MNLEKGWKIHFSTQQEEPPLSLDVDRRMYRARTIDFFIAKDGERVVDIKDAKEGYISGAHLAELQDCLNSRSNFDPLRSDTWNDREKATYLTGYEEATNSRDMDWSLALVDTLEEVFGVDWAYDINDEDAYAVADRIKELVRERIKP